MSTEPISSIYALAFRSEGLLRPISIQSSVSKLLTGSLAAISCTSWLRETYANAAHFQLINATNLICGKPHYGPEGRQGDDRALLRHAPGNEENPGKELC